MNHSEVIGMLFTKRPLIVNPELACAIGLNEAIVLQQIHYWLDRSNNERDGCKWVYKTYEEWSEEFPFWSIATIRRAISKLEKSGLILSTQEYNKMKMDKTKWYTIADEGMSSPCDQNEQRLLQNEQRLLQNEQTNNQRLPTETTTETTTEREGSDTSRFDGHCGPPPFSGPVTPAKPTKRQAIDPLKNADPRKIGADGYVAKGAGATPLEVYWEVFTHRPTKSQINAIADTVTDLDKWRSTLISWSLKGHRPNNFEGLIDVYANGWRTKQNANGNGKSAGSDGIWTEWATPVDTGEPINVDDIDF